MAAAHRDLAHPPGASARPDVIVVGGGVVGTSTAYQLAKRGKRVLLIERRGLASGASGRNGGLTGAGGSMVHDETTQAILAMGTANLRMMIELPRELDADFELLRPGHFDIATTPEQEAHILLGIKERREAGQEAHYLDPVEARKLMPALADDILGAEFLPQGGHLWPFAVVHAFARAAVRYGAEIRIGPNVTELVRRGDAVEGVVLDTGEVLSADAIVLCTNAYTPHILPELPQGAIVPARGQILVTEPLPPLIPYPWGHNFDKEYGRQTADGKLLAGGFRRLDEDEGLGHEEEHVTPAVINGIRGLLARLFPATRHVNVVRCWAGIMGFTADGLPLIGPYAGRPGLFVAAGFNGGGFSWAAITGKVMAALVSGDDPGMNIRPFRPERFAERVAAGESLAWANPYTAGERNNPRQEQVAIHESLMSQ